MIAIFSSREFNKNLLKVKRAAEVGPVVITHRGKFRYVLLTFMDYQRISGKRKNILDLVGMRGAGEVEFEPEKISFYM